MTTAEYTAIVQFLARQEEACEKGRDKARAMALISTGLGQDKMLAYWTNVSSGIKWMKGNATRAYVGRANRKRLTTVDQEHAANQDA